MIGCIDYFFLFFADFFFGTFPRTELIIAPVLLINKMETAIQPIAGIQQRKEIMTRPRINCPSLFQEARGFGL